MRPLPAQAYGFAATAAIRPRTGRAVRDRRACRIRRLPPCADERCARARRERHGIANIGLESVLALVLYFWLAALLFGT